MNVYQENGFNTRREVSSESSRRFWCWWERGVFTGIGVWGSSEDFDGLVSSLEDFADAY